MSQILFKKTLIIGLGLIGGSFAKALRRHKISEKIFAYDLDLESLDCAKEDGVLDEISDNIGSFYDEFAEFDFIVLATPLSAYEEIFSTISDKISPNALGIDLGSIKDLDFPTNFIPCHPIAGAENNGYSYAVADLFVNKKFIICKQNYPQNLDEVVKKIGAIPQFLEAKKHDEIYALVSHLPQFLSFLTKEFSPKNIKDEFLKNAFRLDNSSPEVWEDIFALNEENIEKFYVKFFENLEKNMKILRSPLDDALRALLEELSAALAPRAKAEGSSRDLLEELSASLAPRAKAEGRRRGVDEEFFEKNFAEIFFRVLVAKSFLEISEIKSLQNYAGSGFKDFTSIVSLLNYDHKKLADLIKKNHKKLTKFFNAIS